MPCCTVPLAPVPCAGLCVDKKATLARIRGRTGLASSLLLSNSAYVHKRNPKFGSYDRVVRIRRAQNICCK